MHKVRMLHPTSGRNNFVPVLNQTDASNTRGQQSQGNQANQVAASNANSVEVTTKTFDAIAAAGSSSTNASSNTSTNHLEK
jgi:hypothetical protein